MLPGLIFRYNYRMGFVKKHSTIFIVTGIILLFFFTRLYNILSLPIFTDEAIYVRWAQYLISGLKFWDFSMTDGKQPSFIWLAAVFMKVISEPLLAGRLVSVLAGLGSLVGIYFLSSETFKDKKVGVVSSLVYILYPFALVYDRLAIYDSLVAMFMIWALDFEIRLVRKPRLYFAMILGIVMGGGMLTKTSNNFAFILLPFSLFLFNFKDKKWKSEIRKWIIYALIAVVIANTIYFVLRLSPYFYIIDQKNATFVYPFKEWFMHPFTFLFGNLKGLVGWIMTYLTAPFLILALSSFLVEKKYFREKLLLLVWFLAPFTALALFGKVIYPRFTLFMTMPLLVLGSYTFYNMYDRSKKNYLKALVVLVFVGSFILNDFLILTNFAKAPIPQADKSQLIESWPSGVGVNETVEFLKKESKDKKIHVVTQGTFGLMPYALEIYLKDNKSITTQGFWPISEKIPNEFIDIARKEPTYFVFYQPCLSCPQTGMAPKSWPVKQVFQIPKLEKGSFYTLYQVTP